MNLPEESINFYRYARRHNDCFIDVQLISYLGVCKLCQPETMVHVVISIDDSAFLITFW